MKRIASIFILAVLLFSCEKTISESQSQNFIKFFGSGYESKGNDVIELADGSYVLTGYNELTKGESQVYIVKVDENGNEIWSHTYGSDESQEVGKVVREFSGGFIIAGTSERGSLTHSFILNLDVNGDSLDYKEFGDSSLNITVNDMVLNDEAIYVAGEFLKTGNSHSNYYYMRLSHLGETEWIDPNKGIDNSGSSLCKVFFENNNPLFVGYDGDVGKVFILALKPDGGERYTYTVPIDAAEVSDAEIISDAVFTDNQLYILSNGINSTNPDISLNTKIHKRSAAGDPIWTSETIASVEGKSLTYTEDGTLIALAETSLLINTIEVDESGIMTYGDDAFRPIAGSVEKVISTRDGGIIFIGSTNATYGTRMQLIKTDKDLFLFRP